MARDIEDAKTLDSAAQIQESNPAQISGSAQETVISGAEDVATAQEALDSFIDETRSKTHFANSFSEEDTRDLIDMWRKQYTVREIAGYLGRPFNNVRNKVAALQKKGIIKARDTRNKVSQTFILETAGEFNVPVDVVSYLSSLFTGGADKIMAQTREAVTQYVAQNGQCYYLGERVRLTMDNTPSGVVVVAVGETNALVCRAVAGMRMSTTHETFLSICRLIALRFAS